MQDKIKNLKIIKAEQEIKIKELYYKMHDSGFYSAETTNMLLNIIIENHGKKSAPVRSQGQNILEALKDYQGRIKVTLVPNITNICYGRGVGYKI